MEIKIFVKKDCPYCPAAKKLGEILEKENFPVKIYDLGTIEGLTEAQFYAVMATPTIVICEGEEEKKSWRGETPSLEEIKKELQ